MRKEITYTIILLAFILASVLQKAGGKTAEKAASTVKSSSIQSPDDLGTLSPLKQAQAVSAPAPFGGYTENIDGVSLELARIPQGTFLMGNDHSPNPEEKPAHRVSIRSFYIGQYEVTRQQWNAVVDKLSKVTRELRRQYIGPGVSGIFGSFDVRYRTKA